MRRFQMYRRNVPDESHSAQVKNAPDEVQFEGVVFHDGTVAVRWRTAMRSTSVWGSFDEMMAVHGHPEYESELVWIDPPIHEQSERTVFTSPPIVVPMPVVDACPRCGESIHA